MLSEKYVAGFLDADGHIGVNWRRLNGRTEPDNPLGYSYPILEFTQEATRIEVLELLAIQYGGLVDYHRGSYCRFRLSGKQARMLLERIQQYLVIKRHYAEVVLNLPTVPQHIESAKAMLYAERRVKSFPLPNYPSRKWLAGYFDGDGALDASMGKKRTSASLYARISASEFDDEGLTIIQKAFGGYIHPKPAPHLRTWSLNLKPSKAREFIGHFGQYLIGKKAQADFILGCVEGMGHYRDGKRIHEILKQLKAQPHRLSEPSVVPSLLETVRNISDAEINALKSVRSFRIWEKRKALTHAIVGVSSS